MNEKAIAAALEPLVDDILALEGRVKALQLLPGDKGDPGTKGDPGAAGDKGEPGARGERGADGAGIAAPQWQAGAVYREGAVVVANMGQHFRALRDTASSTDDREHWERLGSGGFRHCGAMKAGAAYAEGDLFVDGFRTFCVVNGAPVMLAGRGEQGRQGAQGFPGAKGDKGERGRDGSTIIGAQVSGFKLVLVQQDADGAVDHIEADFGPAFRELLREALAELVPA